MICGPLAQISPGWPNGTSLPSSSRIEISVEGTGTPIEPLNSEEVAVLQVNVGEVSERPYPSAMLQPVGFSHASAPGRCTAMPPPFDILSFEKSILSKPGVCNSPL